MLVLYAGERLGMNAVGFGLLTTATAVGGIIGTVSYGRLERRFSLADLMRMGLLIETGTHLVLALTTSAVVALATFVVFGVHEFVWGTTSTVVRQRAVPDALLGRVGGVYRVAIIGGLVIGTPIGGLLARNFGITAPFWFGFVGLAVPRHRPVAAVRPHHPRERGSTDGQGSVDDAAAALSGSAIDLSSARSGSPVHGTALPTSSSSWRSSARTRRRPGARARQGRVGQPGGPRLPDAAAVVRPHLRRPSPAEGAAVGLDVAGVVESVGPG